MKYIYGIDIGGTTIKMGLFAEDGTLKEKWEIKTRTDRQRTDCKRTERRKRAAAKENIQAG